MPLLHRARRAAAAPPSPPLTTGALLRKWTIPVIGAVTPVMLIVVNIAAFIMRHLAEFRWAIAVLAFVSSMMLNSWTLLNAYRTGRRRLPNQSVFQEGNEETVLIVGMAVIIVVSFLTAFFCYKGLDDPDNLPNSMTFFTGVAAILIPILLQAFFRRELGGGHRRGRGQVPARSGPGADGPSPRGGGGGASSYGPPGSLPPS